MFAMAPFDWNEMYFVGYVVDGDGHRNVFRTQIENRAISPDDFNDAFTHYGSSVRHCFKFARGKSVRDAWEGDITTILYYVPDLANFVHSVRMMQTDWSEDLASRLFCINPSSKRHSVVGVATPRIVGKIQEVLLVKDNAKHWEMFNAFRLHPATLMTAGRL
ncbi:hypothetical protein FRB95_003696 [Tulasnella sp. JGI-2019a]|nr:hypothetical protein FRB93_009982 [Tulasnella sp. JGI-2019a]KAG9037857.1 hypothetical protein FRB95_003696 [Tulasnella sp. JGI-2019a]